MLYTSYNKSWVPKKSLEGARKWSEWTCMGFQNKATLIHPSRRYTQNRTMLKCVEEVRTLFSSRRKTFSFPNDGWWLCSFNVAHFLISLFTSWISLCFPFTRLEVNVVFGSAWSGEMFIKWDKNEIILFMSCWGWREWVQHLYFSHISSQVSLASANTRVNWEAENSGKSSGKVFLHFSSLHNNFFVLFQLEKRVKDFNLKRYLIWQLSL